LIVVAAAGGLDTESTTSPITIQTIQLRFSTRIFYPLLSIR